VAKAQITALDTFPSLGNLTSSYNHGYSSMNTQMSGFSYMVGSRSTTTTSSNIAGMYKQSLKVQLSMSFKHGYRKSTSSTNVSNSNFTIGPDPGYGGPMQFVVYHQSTCTARCVQRSVRCSSSCRASARRWDDAAAGKPTRRVSSA
jgi:hypothetical protein